MARDDGEHYTVLILYCTVLCCTGNALWRGMMGNITPGSGLGVG